MINLQVDDLDGVLDCLIDEGVTVDPKPKSYDFGGVGWFTDPEGNRVELWQPVANIPRICRGALIFNPTSGQKFPLNAAAQNRTTRGEHHRVTESTMTRCLERYGETSTFAIAPCHMTMTISLGFHDVLDKGQLALMAPGHRTVYTLERQVFLEHLAAIRASAGVQAVSRVDQVAADHSSAVFLTVDDGRVSAVDCIAPALEKLGWRGHFFVTTKLIGRRGYLDCEQIRELHRRGHLIGSHSCSHPEQMSSLSWDELLREWGESCAALSDLIAAPVTVASVPGGFYSQRVGHAAAASGIKVLFTSEPTASEQTVDGCRILGRYSVRRFTPPSVVGAIAAGSRWPRWQQAVLWFISKTAKRVTGPWYIPLRRMVLDTISRR